MPVHNKSSPVLVELERHNELFCFPSQIFSDLRDYNK